MKDYYEKEILSGSWLYDNLVKQTVQIFALNYDYYYEIAKADNQIEPNEKPELNENGESFMIKWGNGEFSVKDLCAKEYGGLDLDSAIEKAERKVQGKIDWNINKNGC
ncbi:hypothetical protein [Persicobacter diffluens]|uniref:Uncharacterized protein n=1 Tax=Persicobacter diffluens TaxID=981 RepID=A0AAN5AKT0_9BACT|nr:hypothetical protein PEDI_12980 [Persicobacter diffluens]